MVLLGWCPVAYRLPGSLTARITLGFLVLVVTFAGISISYVRSTERLNQWIRVTHEGYLQLALVSGDLDSKQGSLLGDLKEMTGERDSERWARSRLKEEIAQRLQLLETSEGILANVGSLVARDSMHSEVQKDFADTEALVHRMSGLVEESRALYDVFLEQDMIDADGQRARPEEALKAREKLIRLETDIDQATGEFKDSVRKMVLRLSKMLKVISRRIWIYTLLFSGMALILGILMTIAARVMLRPLQRLGDAARRIAHGDYAHRIAVQGPTEIAELAHEFNVMGKAIEDRSRELVRTERLATAGKMAAMITHEVRNPLSSISLNTELLEEELAALPEERGIEAQSLCRSITKEVDRLTDITEEYLQLARLPTPKLQEESLENITRSVVDFIREQLASRGVTIELNAEDGPRLSLDEGQIRQALLNLIRNAAEAVDELDDGKVIVSIRQETDSEGVSSLLLEVRDNGPGIPEEMMPTLFEAFVSSKSSGTGLGLALTQQIISDHGATIEARNADDQGAVFCVAFPLATAKTPG